MKLKSTSYIWIAITLLGAVIISLYIFSTIPNHLSRVTPTLPPPPSTPAPHASETFTPIPSLTQTVSLTVTPSPTVAVLLTPSSYTASTFRKGPYLLYQGNNTQMEVIWQLDEAVQSILEWGRNGQYLDGNVTMIENSSDHLYRYIIQDLLPGTKYEYRVSVLDSLTGGSFITAPDTGAVDLKFFVYGDTRDGTIFHDEIASRIQSSYTFDPTFQTFILATGDLVDDGDLEWMWDNQLFDPKYSNIRTVFANLTFLPVKGNHDGNGDLFMKYFPGPLVGLSYWSFDYGPAHIVMLDQYSPFEKGSDQYKWLLKDLNSSTKTWKFIVMHEPGWSASENNMAVQRTIVPLAEQYGVSIVFAGHNHYYARSEVNGVTHITAGGGGAPLYEPNPKAQHVVATSMTHGYLEISIQGTTLKGTAIDIDGNIIDEFSLVK